MKELLRWCGICLALLCAVGAEAQVPQGPIAIPAICSRGDSITNTATTSVDTLFGGGSVGTGSCLVQAGVLTKSASSTYSTSLHIKTSGHVKNNADAKTVRIQFASVVLDTLIITASAANQWEFDCQITVRTPTSGASNQPVYCKGHQGDGTATTVTGGAVASFDPTIAQPVQVTISQAGASDIILDQIMVWLDQ
jgi:hypothetical protein